MFIESLYNNVSRPLQGTWANENNEFKFDIEPKVNHLETPEDAYDMVLYIDGQRKGLVDLKFTEDGRCFILVDGMEWYKIHAMYPKDSNQMMTLIEPDTTSLVFRKMGIL